jgi:hypothetical protein
MVFLGVVLIGVPLFGLLAPAEAGRDDPAAVVSQSEGKHSFQ